MSVSTTKLMYEKYSPQALKVLLLAGAEAERRGHNRLGSELLLLGLMGTGGGNAASVLASEGLTFESLSAVVNETIGKGHDFQQQSFYQKVLHVLKGQPLPPYSQNTWSALVKALQLFEDCRVETIGTDLILLGLLSVEDCRATEILRRAGADLKALKEGCIASLEDSVEC